MRKLLVIFCLVGVFSIGASSAVEASDYPKYDGKISPIVLPVDIRYRPIILSPVTREMFILMDMGRQKSEVEFKTEGLVESKKKNGHLILSIKWDPDKTSFTINGEDASDKLKVRRGLKTYFEITDTGELLKSNNNKVEATAVAGLAPKLINSIVKKPNQLVTESSWSMVTSQKIPSNAVFKAFAVGTSEYKDRKILVTKVIGEMDIGGQIRVPLQGYQLLDITTGYILEMKAAGATKIQVKDQAVAFRMKFSSIFDLPVSSVRSLQSTTASSVKQKQQSNQDSTLTLEKAKSACSQLGFKKGTKKYGECVLYLHK